VDEFFPNLPQGLRSGFPASPDFSIYHMLTPEYCMTKQMKIIHKYPKILQHSFMMSELLDQLAHKVLVNSWDVIRLQATVVHYQDHKYYYNYD